MILNWDRIWTEMVTAIYRVRGLSRVTIEPPPVPVRKPPRRGRTSDYENIES
jgi:hypothetical protein